jgi:hypothetical protein
LEKRKEYPVISAQQQLSLHEFSEVEKMHDRQIVVVSDENQ